MLKNRIGSSGTAQQSRKPLEIIGGSIPLKAFDPDGAAGSLSALSRLMAIADIIRHSALR
jgi:hypothetical protein